MIAPSAPYDDVADWYEHDFLATQRAVGVDGFADRLGIDRSLAELLGAGTGTCLEIGCGTGIYADRVRQLGRTPIGVDVSAGMLHHATGRLPIALSDASTLAVATSSVPAVIAVMVHTDMADYPTVLAEAFRVLTPGGSSSTSACIPASVVVSRTAPTSTRSLSSPATSTEPGPPTRGPTVAYATKSALFITRSPNSSTR